MERKEYNGWSNYETWAVNLWLTNDEGGDAYWREQAQEAYDGAEAGTHYTSQTREEHATSLLADAIEEWHGERADEIGVTDGSKAGVFADLVGAALSEVNWHEIAEHFIADVDKEPDEPEGEAEAAETAGGES